MRVELVVITMAGSQYVLYDRGGPAFPSGELAEAEAPVAAARRIVKEWTGTDAPKLELCDLRSAPGSLLLVFRAILTSDPQGPSIRLDRMGLPDKVGALLGKDVEETLRTSLSYKLTRA